MVRGKTMILLTQQSTIPGIVLSHMEMK